MIDTARIDIKGGNGGNGCASFLREKYRPDGGPNGGDGGDGGSAYLCGDPSLNTLLHLKFTSTVYVDAGGHGRGKTRRGENGQDTVIRVPLGTEVWRQTRSGGKEFLVDITTTTPVLVARGGRGGWGNRHYVSPTVQEPVLAQAGERGERVVLFLELKLLADVGILARPNAGKSTLISRCSAAKPRIADYPFTTVEPVLGAVSRHNKDFVMMEVPGLLEGAHRGVGLGHEFLRHAERARLYIHLLDGLAEDPVADFAMLNHELQQFSAALAQKPQLVVVNKLDVTEVREGKKQLEAALRQRGGVGKEGCAAVADIPFISAATGEGVEQMLEAVAKMLDALRKDSVTVAPEPSAVTMPPRARMRPGVAVEDGVFIVRSSDLERLVSRADTTDRRVLLQLWQEMRRYGVADLLEEAGIQAGDTIRIGKTEVAWF